MRCRARPASERFQTRDLLRATNVISAATHENDADKNVGDLLQPTPSSWTQVPSGRVVPAGSGNMTRKELHQASRPLHAQRRRLHDRLWPKSVRRARHLKTLYQLEICS